MKEVMAIIRMNMINKTKQELSKEGFPSLTARKVLGRGKKKVDFSLIQNLVNEHVMEVPQLAEEVSEQHRLVPKRLLTMVVNDEDVKKVVSIIMEVNSTGSPGDGKIFVLPIMETIRVRTGETGTAAI
jgi:nitrogen regulatory protein PII 2